MIKYLWFIPKILKHQVKHIHKRQEFRQESDLEGLAQRQIRKEREETHNLSFTQKPLEVVFLDVHQRGDVRDVEAAVFYMTCLLVHLHTKHTNSSVFRQKTAVRLFSSTRRH